MAHRSEFPPICVALGCAESEKLETLAGAACDAGEQFLELRLDMLDQPERGIAVIRGLQGRYPDLYLIATCRRRQNGGQFRGGAADQWRILEAAVEAGARAVDIEIETAAADPDRVEAMRKRSRVIVSYHNFQSTPPLAPILRRLEAAPADISKLVTTARRPTDNLRILELAGSRHRRPLVVLAMGEAGSPTRLLSLARHCPFTYASFDSSEPTAPGQISSRSARRQYRVERQGPETQVYGVIACPVAHSISPAVHNRAFQARRVDAVYLPFLVEPRLLGDFFTLAAGLPVAGFSVTIPHKQRVIRHLDSVDPQARRIGAVNTVYRRQGKLHGTNTDVAGVTVPLEKRLKLKNARILVAGNGGAARAAVFALAGRGARVILTGRNLSRVRALARVCGAGVLSREQAEAGQFDALVHATSAGMRPNTAESFFPDRIPAEVVFDMVYNPLETLLLKKARAQGKKVIPGLEMFLEQAAAQFEIWTGEPAPRPAMETAAREALASHAA